MTARIQIRDAGDLAAQLPRMLGHEPQRSLVVIGLSPAADRVSFVVRFDLPAPPALVAGRIVSGAALQNCRHVVAVGYGAAALVTPVMEVLMPQAADAGITVVDALRVGESHYWSYLSPRVQGIPVGAPAPAPECPPDLAALLVAQTGRQQRLMRQARARVAEDAGKLAAGGGAQAVREAGIAIVRAAVTACHAGRLGDAGLHAWLALALTDCHVRDVAWSLMEPRYAGAHRRLWAVVTRRAPAAGGYCAAPALLLAFTAYQGQQLALARAALAVADADAPGYLMAIALRRAIDKGTPPASLIPRLTGNGGDHS